MTNPLFRKKADQTELVQQFLIDNGWAEAQSREGMAFTKESFGTVVWDETGWTFFDPRGKEKDFGSNLGDLKTFLGVPTHPEEGFYRGKKFRAPGADPDYDPNVVKNLLDKPEVDWQTDDKGEKVPTFENDQDKKFLKDLRISRQLRRKVIAAYMNGYAEHAAKWLRDKGNTYRGSEKYAESNGLRPEYFRDAIQTMSRYGAYRKKIASKSAGTAVSLPVPLESASHVAFHLFKAGLPDFSVETDEDAYVAYFSFDSLQDLEVAHKLIYQAFKRQIEAGKGAWANWREEEAHPENPDRPHKETFIPKENLASGEKRNDLDACIYCKGQEPKNRAQRKRLKDTPRNRNRELSLYRALTPKASLLTKKEAGIWGERSYDNDVVHDILDKHRLNLNDPGGEKSRGFDEAIPHDELTSLYTTLDSLYENVGGDDEAHFLGVVVFLLEHGTKVPPTYRSAAAGIARRMLRDPQYLKSWKNPQQRERVLKSELAMLGGMAMHANLEDDSPFHEIADPVCLCTHTFHDHERGCDHCDCPGFDPAPIEKQVEYVCEHRSFGRVGKLKNPMTFERHDGEMKMKVWFKDGRVEKAQFSDAQGSGKPDVRLGWDGFFSITQAFGD